MATDWSKMTVSQLKAELSKRDLDNTGKKKADLIARLEEHDKETAKEAEMATGDIIDQIDEVTKDAEADVKEEGMEADAAENGGEENGDEEDEKAGEEEEVPDAEADTEAQEDGDDADKMEQDADQESAEKDDGDDNEDDAEKSEEKEVEKKNFYDFTKNATGFILSLSEGQKIVIPSKDTLKTDLLCYTQPRTVWVYPLVLEDITSGLFNEFIERCVHFQITFHEETDGTEKSKKGYLECVWADEEQAIEQAELLDQIRDGLIVKRLTLKDKRDDALKELPVEVSNHDQLLKRYLYIGNLPPTATSQALQSLFPDANRLAVMANEEGLPKGYALAEMPTEEAADRATKMYMNVEFEDQNLVVMRAWLKIPKGLLDHETRVELLKTVKRDRLKMRARILDTYTRRKLENEMTLAKQRLDKDCKTREDLGLPFAPDIVRREEMLKEQQKLRAEAESKEESGKEDKSQPKKFTRNTNSAPYNRQRGGRANRRGVPSLIRGAGRYGNPGGYPARSYSNYNDGGNYGNQYSNNQGGGDYNQAVQMLVQVSKMLGTGGQQGPSGYGGGYGGGGSSYGGNDYNSGYGGSGYGGYGGTKRPAADDGFRGYNKRGSGGRNQRRW